MWQEVDVEELKKAPWNYKGEDEKMQAVLDGNIARRKQIENIVVREMDGFYEIINGNHRLPSFKSAGIDKVMTFNVGKVSDAEAARIAIELNETRFESDGLKLAKRIEEIKQEVPDEELRDTLPFTEKELESFDSMSTFDWDADAPNNKYDPLDEREEGGATNAGGAYEEKRTIFFKLDPQYAEDFEELIKQIKLHLYPDEVPYRIDDEQAIAFILSKCQEHL